MGSMTMDLSPASGDESSKPLLGSGQWGETCTRSGQWQVLVHQRKCRSGNEHHHKRNRSNNIQHISWSPVISGKLDLLLYAARKMVLLIIQGQNHYPKLEASTTQCTRSSSHNAPCALPLCTPFSFLKLLQKLTPLKTFHGYIGRFALNLGPLGLDFKAVAPALPASTGSYR